MALCEYQCKFQRKVPVMDENARWQKSSLSYANGACVEVARLPDGGAWVRNSRDPRGSALRFTKAEWDAFTGGVLLGEFTGE